MKNRNLRFPVGTAAGKRRFLLFTGLFPQLSADKFQHTARDAAGLIRNEKTVGKFLFARVYIGHLKTGRYRITAAQKYLFLPTARECILLLWESFRLNAPH